MEKPERLKPQAFALFTYSALSDLAIWLLLPPTPWLLNDRFMLAFNIIALFFPADDAAATAWRFIVANDVERESTDCAPGLECSLALPRKDDAGALEECLAPLNAKGSALYNIGVSSLFWWVVAVVAGRGEIERKRTRRWKRERVEE